MGPHMTASVLQVEGLTVRLPAGADRVNAVENVSFSVAPGEIVCVVGESGSGKSVTAHAIMGLLPRNQLSVAAGRVLLEGENLLVKSPAEMRRIRGHRISMIFQEPMTALNPVMKVGDQIAEVLDIHSDLTDGERRERVLEVMRSVHLPEPERMIDVYPHQLSGGQRQRIMIAAALVLDPVLLIADEPTTALDVTTQAQILKLIKELRERRNTGVLFITHDFGVVAEVAHRVVVMQHGRVVEQGSTEDVLRRPRDDYTRMLIRSVPSLSPPVRAAITAAPIVLKTEGLTKTYVSGGLFEKRRVVQAAKDVNLHVRRGETLGVVGESGSGKSTVARCIARLIEPSDGAILIEGADVAKLIVRRAAPAPQARADRVPGPVSLAQSAPLGRRRDRGGPDQFRHGAERRARARARADAPGRPRPGFAGALPAPVLGRPAPAHLHRARARDGPGDSGGRRAGLGARRLGAGAGARTDRRRAQALQSRGAVHHPRSARRRAGVRPHRRDAPGRGGRGRHDRRGVRRAEARLHPRAVRQRAGEEFRVREV